MKKLLGMEKRPRSLLLASAFAPVFFGVLIGGVGPARLQSPTRGQINEIKIINKTTTLEVLGLRPTDPNQLVILLKNVSSKALNGYSVSVNGVRITKDISSGDRVIPPGQTDELDIPIDVLPPNLTILAAMFADGTIEGDPEIVERLREWRLGLKEQLTTALAVLDATLESADVNTVTALDSLESRFFSLSIESDKTKPHSAGASRDARADMFDDIQILRQKRLHLGALNQRKRLLELKGRLERRIANL